MPRILHVFLLSVLTIPASLIPALAQEEIYPENIIYATSRQAVSFSHKKHVDDFGLDCTACHSEIFEMKAYAVRKNGDFTMNGICDGKYCGACHNGDKAFRADDFMQCARCHSGTENGSVEKATSPSR